jgi:hypothetical protein
MDEFFTLPVDINEVKDIAEITNDVLVNLLDSRNQLDPEVYVLDDRGILVSDYQKQNSIISEKIDILSTAKAGLDQLSKRTTFVVPADLAAAICNQVAGGSDFAGSPTEQNCLRMVQRFYDELKSESGMLTVAEMYKEVELSRRHKILEKHRKLALKRALELLELQKMNERLKQLSTYHKYEPLPPTQSLVVPSGMPVITPAPVTSGGHVISFPLGWQVGVPHYDEATGTTWILDCVNCEPRKVGNEQEIPNEE